ncbi:VanW family protein [Candidatus Peregrinibacteria bacterium]|nr:VanW family protein [Candidatus Peregrinibacteria bacterium]
MSKKKKRSSTKNKQVKKLKKTLSSSEQLPQAEATTAIVVTLPEQESTETTFSKKLEEVIHQTETDSKKGFWAKKIILLGPPGSYSKKQWKELLADLGWGLLRFSIVVLIIGTVSASLVYFEYLASGKILPGVVFAQKIEMGSLNTEDAKQKLFSALEAYQKSSLTFTYEDQSIEIPLTELGIVFSADQTYEKLPVFNYQKNGVANLVSGYLNKTDLNPTYQKDDHQLFNLIEVKTGLRDKRAKSAQFSLDDKKKIQITPEAEGVIIDQADLIAQVNQRLNSLDSSPIAIQTLQEIPQVDSQSLEADKDDIIVKLESQIAINYQDKKWDFKGMDYLSKLTYNKDNDQIIIRLTPALLETDLKEKIFSTIEKPVSDMKIHYDDKDQIIFEGKALDGLAINMDQFTKDLELAINALGNEVDITTSETKAKLEIDQRLQEMGIKELVSTGHTAFAGSPNNRRHNIATGMAKFNGLIIKPGETFSFNEHLGEVDGSTGYKLELVIKAEGTVPEYGGGVCQVSSTMFKAALFAGFPIVERAPHSYAVSYYAQIDGYGLDSTIYPGVRDLQFTNDSGSNILIQTFVDGNDAYINFFGTSDGRQVKLENYWRGNYRGAGGTQLIPTKTLPPGARKQIEAAHGGFDASWDRVITKNGEETREKIYSVYRATANRILVGEE